MGAVTLNQASAAEKELQWTWKREDFLTGKKNFQLLLYSKRVIVEEIAEELKLISDEVYQEFLNSCFGFLMSFDTQGFACRTLLHWLFAHEVIKADARPDELWYRVGGRFIRFSKYEYALVTGLSFGPTAFDPSAKHHPPASGLFLRHYKGQKLTMDTLRCDFTDGVFRKSAADALKVAKLLIVYFLLFGWNGRVTYIDEWAWTLIEDTDQWETFMWGKYAYQILLRKLQGVPTVLPNTKSPFYELNGYVWAFLIWAFEAIPEFGNACGVHISDDVLPRCLRWGFPNTRMAKGGFHFHPMEVHPTLEPSEEEQRQPYWEHIHDDHRSFKKNRMMTPVQPSSREVPPVSRPQRATATCTRGSLSTSGMPMKFMKKRKRTDPLTARAARRVADQEKAKHLSDNESGYRDEITSTMQKKLPDLLRQELPLALKEIFSQGCGMAVSDRLFPIGGAESSRCLRSPVTVFKRHKDDALEADCSPLPKTCDIRNVEKLRIDLDFTDSEPELLDVAVDQAGPNKLLFELNEKINELKNKNLENEQLVGVFQEKYKHFDTMVVEMGKEIEKLRYEKLAAIKTVEELKRKNLEANLKKLESDKAAELYKSRLEKLILKSMKIEADMLTVEVGDLSNLVNDVHKPATSEEGGNLDIRNLKAGKDKSGNGPNGHTENVVVMSRGVRSISNTSGSRSSELSKKGTGDRNSVQSRTREDDDDDAHAIKTSRSSQSRNDPPEAESNDTLKYNEHRRPRASGDNKMELNGSSDDDASTEDTYDSCTDSRMDDLIVSIWSKNLSRKWTYEADMLRAFQKDEQLCMDAVCALYRQHVVSRKSKGCSKIGGFRPVDSRSGCALAEYLIDGNVGLRLRKSVSEVKKERPAAISQCRKLATTYAERLFHIYCEADDPFFGQS